MNDHLVTLVGDEDHDLQQVGGAVGTDDESSVGILTHVLDDQRMLDGVEHVVVSDAVSASGPMDLHTPLL